MIAAAAAAELCLEEYSLPSGLLQGFFTVFNLTSSYSSSFTVHSRATVVTKTNSLHLLFLCPLSFTFLPFGWFCPLFFFCLFFFGSVCLCLVTDFLSFFFWCIISISNFFVLLGSVHFCLGWSLMSIWRWRRILIFVSLIQQTFPPSPLLPPTVYLAFTFDLLFLERSIPFPHSLTPLRWFFISSLPPPPPLPPLLTRIGFYICLSLTLSLSLSLFDSFFLFTRMPHRRLPSASACLSSPSISLSFRLTSMLLYGLLLRMFIVLIWLVTKEDVTNSPSPPSPFPPSLSLSLYLPHPLRPYQQISLPPLSPLDHPRNISGVFSITQHANFFSSYFFSLNFILNSNELNFRVFFSLSLSLSFSLPNVLWIWTR